MSKKDENNTKIELLTLNDSNVGDKKEGTPDNAGEAFMKALIQRVISVEDVKNSSLVDLVAILATKDDKTEDVEHDLLSSHDLLSPFGDPEDHKADNVDIDLERDSIISDLGVRELTRE